MEIEELVLAVTEVVACDPDRDEVTLMVVTEPDESVVVTGIDDDTTLVAALELATTEVDPVLSVVLSVKKNGRNGASQGDRWC